MESIYDRGEGGGGRQNTIKITPVVRAGHVVVVLGKGVGGGRIHDMAVCVHYVLIFETSDKWSNVHQLVVILKCINTRYFRKVDFYNVS